jgi:hypothetical protein
LVWFNSFGQILPFLKKNGDNLKVCETDDAELLSKSSVEYSVNFETSGVELGSSVQYTYTFTYTV